MSFVLLFVSAGEKNSYDDRVDDFDSSYYTEFKERVMIANGCIYSICIRLIQVLVTRNQGTPLLFF